MFWLEGGIFICDQWKRSRPRPTDISIVRYPAANSERRRGEAGRRDRAIAKLWSKFYQPKDNKRALTQTRTHTLVRRCAYSGTGYSPYHVNKHRYQPRSDTTKITMKKARRRWLTISNAEKEKYCSSTRTPVSELHKDKLYKPTKMSTLGYYQGKEVSVWDTVRKIL